MAFKIILAIVAVNRVRFARFLSRFSRETSLEESEIRSRVQTFVTALEQAGIDHSEPIPDEESVGGSGAEARFVLDVNGCRRINIIRMLSTLLNLVHYLNKLNYY